MPEPIVEIRESREFCCQKCGAKLADSLRARFWPAGSRVEISARGGDKVRLRCPECGTSVLWTAMT